MIREVNAAEMEATLWIMELKNKEFIMQYSQTVFLDFFSSNYPNKLIRWPHVSINTLKKGLN